MEGRSVTKTGGWTATLPANAAQRATQSFYGLSSHRDTMTRKQFIWASAVMTVALMLLQFAWAFSAPAFRGPDEPIHVNSVFRLATTGTWPEPGDAMVDPTVMQASKEAGFILPFATDFSYDNRYQLHYSRRSGNMPEVGDAHLPPHDERVKISTIGPRPAGATVVDQMTQHPPVYYGLAGLVVKAFNLYNLPWDYSVLALRVFSIFLLIPLTPSLIYTARRMGASRPWALGAGLIPVAIPQVYHICTMVTNDVLAVSLGALVMAALAKAGTEKISWLTISLVGVSLGLALWAKGQILVFGLPLILVFAFRPEPWKTRLKAILASGTMSLAIGWWWMLNIVRYHTVQPGGYPQQYPADWDPSQADLAFFLSTAADAYNRSFWASYGWLEVVYYPLWLRTGLTVVVIILFLIGVANCRSPFTAFSMGITSVGLAALLFGQAWIGSYLPGGQVAGMQGRYAFPFIVAMAVCILAFNQRSTIQLSGFAVLSGLSGGIGFIFLLKACYKSGAWYSNSQLAQQAGVDVATVRLVLVLGAVGALVAIGTVMWSARMLIPHVDQAPRHAQRVEH